MFSGVERQRQSTHESAVEEKSLGLSIPEEEEEGSIGHELYDGFLPSWCRPVGFENEGGGSAGFSAHLMHDANNIVNTIPLIYILHLNHPSCLITN